MQAGFDQALARDVINIEHIVKLLLTASSFRRNLDQWPDRRCILVGGLNRNELPFGLSESGEFASENRASVNIYGVVQPFGLRH